MAVLIRTNGQCTRVLIVDSAKYFVEIKKLTGFETLEITSIRERRIMNQRVNTMLMDEEGLLNRRPMNPMASSLAGQTIVGDVVVGSLVTDDDAETESFT